MNFILPDLLEDSLESLRAVFKAKGDSKVTLLAQERVSRAKKMMTPFVLRRRKDQARERWSHIIASTLTLWFLGVERITQEDGAN
jgi:hypothetical protein